MIPNYYPDEQPTSAPNLAALAAQKNKLLERIQRAVDARDPDRYEKLMKQLRLLNKVEVKTAYALKPKSTGIWK